MSNPLNPPTNDFLSELCSKVPATDGGGLGVAIEAAKPPVKRVPREAASPVRRRQALEIASLYSRNGLWFVPMPVLDEEDFHKLVAQAGQRLSQIEAEEIEAEKQAAADAPRIQLLS
jgi:hypothetical protein